MMHFLRNLGIGQRTLLIFAVPMLLIILTLGYRITSGYMDDARNALDTRGAHMARQLAALCEFGLYGQDSAELNKQAASVAQEEDVVAVRIMDADGLTLAQAGSTEPADGDNRFVSYTAAVLRTGIDISDFESETAPDGSGGTFRPVLGHVTVTLSTAALLQSLRNTLFSGSILTFSGLLASILLAYIVARSVSGPIRQLTAVVGRLTGGDLSARVREGSPGELGSLEAGINQMANTLQNAQNELERDIRDATAALQRTVAELESRNIELDHARDVAVHAAAAKTDFLARMSHEIRTPLSAIIGFNDLLGKTRLSENQQEYARTIRQAARQLLLVIEDILGYTKLESGALQLEPAPFNLHDCLENVVSMLGASAHGKALELVLYIHSDVPRFVVSDQNRISQILTNLAANAIKFTDKGHVVVEVSLTESTPDSDTVRIAVTDTGIGLSADQVGQIFSPFVQADVSTSRKYGGTGLGLSISKKLVELLGGEITVSSQPGAGSVFSFTLSSPRLEESDNLPAKVLAGWTVLIYDENPFSLRALRNRFFTWGATVFNTSDPERLRQMLAAQGRDATPCDLLVAGLPNAEFTSHSCNELCVRYATPVPIPRLFLVSAELNDPAPDSTCLENCRILPKPVRSDLLLRTARALLKLPDSTASITPSPALPAASDGIPSGLDVLIVEDNPFNRDLFNRLLGELGISTTLADNGNAACELAGRHRYDLIFMDIHMPVMGGIEATQHIRQGINRDTPIIALTADVFTGQQQDLARTGFDDCLHKPLSEARLIAMLQQWGKPGARSRAADARQTAETAPAAGSPSTGISFPPEFHLRLHRELETRLRALRQAIEAGDETGVRDEMHQLKGVVDYFALDAFHTSFHTLQAALRQGRTAEVEAAIDTLQRLLADWSYES